MNGIDVLIPCYNYGKYLNACVASAFEGNCRPVRVLIIDDASPDETPQIASALAARHPSVSYVRNESNIGHISTYNKGLHWAQSAYFVLLSADDLLAPGALDRAASFLDAHPDVGMVYGRTRTFQDAPPVLMSEPGHRETVIDGLEFIQTVYGKARNPIDSPASVVVSTDLQHAVGGYLHELPHAGDLEMWFRFAAHADVGFLDVDQGLYRRHASNMSLGYRDLADYNQRLLVFESICQRYGSRIPNQAALLQRAKRTMAAEIFWAASRSFERGDDLDIDGHLKLSATLDPEICLLPAWRHFHIKRLIGRRLAWSAAALLSRVRGDNRGSCLSAGGT